MKLKLLLVACLLFASVAHLARADDDLEELEVEEDETEEEEEFVADDGFSQEERDAMEAGKESFEFQAEVTRLMDIIINSLYSNREIFIRELISNSADALDKVRFQALTDKSALDGAEEMEIKISYDRDAKTLSLRDTGVGMTREELAKNLGVVAKSGTTEFVERAASGQDSLSLIGQFGVGFYSVYLVADKVTVVSKSNQDPTQHVWQSTADRTFTIAEDPRGNTLGRGTEIILHLKEDAEEFLNEAKLEGLVSRYSSFIDFPIYLWVTNTIEVEVPIEYEDEEEVVEDIDAEEGAEDDLDVSEDEEEEERPQFKMEKQQVQEWKRLNDAKAIWTRSPSEITDDEYEAFYTALTKDEGGSLTKIHFTAEGEITFRAILYVPKTADPQLYDRFYEKTTGLKLYVRRVLISDEFEDFLPRYLNFVKGVVDSEDLPLNVSRETLAQSRVLKVMSKKLTRKVLEMLRKLAAEAEEEEEEDEEDEEEEGEEDEEEEEIAEEEVVTRYDEFWEQYGKSIKLGLIDDRSNKSKLAKLVRFPTSKSDGKAVSLESYVDRMEDDQKYIYYITGESIEAVENSPFLEQLKKLDYEVIYMIDPLDEYVVQSLTEFDGNQLMSVTKEGLKLGNEEKQKKRLEKLAEEYSDFTDWLENVYGDKVEKVAVSNRLATSPCILVTGQYGWSANMERIMKAQTFADPSKQQWMHSKKTMEINPHHPIMRELNKLSDGDDQDAAEDLAELLYDAAMVQSGFGVDNADFFAQRIHRVVAAGLNVDPSEEVPEMEFDDEEEEEEEEEAEEEDEEEAEDLDRDEL
jgi:heat shock protein beta